MKKLKTQIISRKNGAKDRKARICWNLMSVDGLWFTINGCKGILPIRPIQKAPIALWGPGPLLDDLHQDLTHFLADLPLQILVFVLCRSLRSDTVLFSKSIYSLGMGCCLVLGWKHCLDWTIRHSNIMIFHEPIHLSIQSVRLFAAFTSPLRQKPSTPVVPKGTFDDILLMSLSSFPRQDPSLSKNLSETLQDFIKLWTLFQKPTL